MSTNERQAFWEAVESGSNPLLSVMHGLVEKWGLPAIIMCLGDIANILAEDAETAPLSPNQRGLIIGACAQVSALSDQMHAEMIFWRSNRMQKLINVLAVTSFVISSAVVASGVYIFVNKDTLLEQIKDAAIEEVSGLLPSLLPVPSLPNADIIPDSIPLPVVPFSI